MVKVDKETNLPEARKLAEMVRGLTISISQMRLYASTHPQVKTNLKATYDLLLKFLAEKKSLTIGVYKGKLVIEKNVLDLSNKMFLNFLNEFRKLNVENMTFTSGLSMKELESLLEVMVTKTEKIEKEGGVKEVFKKKNIGHIQINEIELTEVAKGKRVVDVSLAGIPEKKPKRNAPLIQGKIDLSKAVELIGRPEFKSVKKVNKRVFAKIVEDYREFKEEAGYTIDNLKKENRRVTTEKRRTESVLRNMNEGVVVVDSKGGVLFMNPAAERLLSTSKSEQVGKHILESLKDEHIVALSEQPSAKEGEGMTKEIEIKGRGDVVKTLKSSGAVIENQEGKTVGMISVLSDVTKQKELEQMKSDFVSNVTHELRTPLFTVKQALATISKVSSGKMGKDEEKLFDVARRNIENLGTLVNDLLDMSKIEAGKLDLKKMLVDIKGLIRDSISTFSPWADNKGIKLEESISGELPEIEIDPNRITQVLGNLLSNAIKFTPQGGRIRVEARLLSAGHIEVSVTDTGIGIAKSNLGKIFDKFQQVDGSIGGTGLGLPIAREIVGLHGGDIKVESDEGKGTKFFFSLPLGQKDS